MLTTQNVSNQGAVSFRTGLLFLALVTLIGCGGGSGDSAAPLSPLVKTGVFVDAPVEGLDYTTATQSGITDSAGTFAYQEGEAVIFSIGTLVLGQATAGGLMSPIDLVPGATDENDHTVTNICRFLQSLDLDADPTNGIRLTQEIRDEINGRPIDFAQSGTEFEADPDLLNLLDALNARDVFSDGNPHELRAAEAARSHLRDSLFQTDRDGDGYAESQGDCNDSDDAAYPGAAEVCGDGIDQDCNGADQDCWATGNDYEPQLLDLINAYRSDHNLEILHFESLLNELAREHSQYMADAGDLNHDGFFDRADRSGFGHCVENVGWNYATPEAQFEGWRNSNGHNLNMLNAAVKYVGVAKQGPYVTFLACGD